MLIFRYQSEVQIIKY